MVLSCRSVHIDRNINVNCLLDETSTHMNSTKDFEEYATSIYRILQNITNYKKKLHRIMFISIIVKVKQSHYRLGQALRVPGGWGSQISRQSAHESGRVVRHTHRPPLLASVRGWVDTRSILRPEEYCQWKIDTVWNRTRDLPTCSVIPQPTVQWHAPIFVIVMISNNTKHLHSYGTEERWSCWLL